MTDNRSENSESNDGRDVDPDLQTEANATDDAPALSPEELDIADSEYVEKLDDSGRYVVSAGGGPPNVPDSISNRSDSGDRPGQPSNDSSSRNTSHSQRTTGERAMSPEAARTLLAEELSRSQARYGLDIVAHFEGETVRHRTVSDDVILTFENLVRWYAQHVTDGTPPDEVVDILLRESTFETEEMPNLAELLERHGLDRTDSIDALVAAIRDESRQ